MRQALEATGRFRVLARLDDPKPIPPPTGARTALYVDAETTGLDPRKDEIIELAMVPFYYEEDGRILGVGEPFSALREPSELISPEITALTGISNEMVKGQAIDPEQVAAFASPAVLVVAHNAAFDRRFLERFSPVFATKAWACSMAEVPWKDEGYEGAKLAFLALEQGFFYDRHRALNDCYAAIELLSRSLPRSGELAFARLLANARIPTFRIWAENSPFDLKDVLKARGYRWNAEASFGPRCWYIDVVETAREAELAFLSAEIYRRETDLTVRRIVAYDRYSERC